VTEEGGREAAILKIQEHTDEDQEKRRCQCVDVEHWSVDVMRWWRWQKVMVMTSNEGGNG